MCERKYEFTKEAELALGESVTNSRLKIHQLLVYLKDLNYKDVKPFTGLHVKDTLLDE